MLYKVLAQRHPEHDPELIGKLRLLYTGGYAIQKRAKEFLARAPLEQDVYFKYRCQQASYIPYFGQLVDYLVGALFRDALQVAPASDAEDDDTPGELPDAAFYQLFAADADRKKNSFSRVLRDTVTDALICGASWVAVDMPPAVAAETRAEEDAAGGARAYCNGIPYEQVFDWSEDEDGALNWIILGKRIQDRLTPDQARDTYVDRFTVWRMDGEMATFEIFETPPIKNGENPKPELDIAGSGPKATTFKRIPVDRLQLPDGLWVGNKVGVLAEEHYRRRSDLIGAMARSLVEIPYVKQGPEIPAVGEGLAVASEDPYRGVDPVGQFKSKGHVLLGPNDEIGFAAPSGKAYEIVDKQLHDLKDEIFRSVHAMALSLANTGAAVGRSAESKAEDRSATEIVLEYFGNIAREFAVKIYSTVSESRGEDVKWVAHGLDSFDLDKRWELADEAKIVTGLNIPSDTFKKEYLASVALAFVPGCSPETKAVIQQEIAKGVEEQEDEDEAALLKMHALSEKIAKSGGDPKAGGGQSPTPVDGRGGRAGSPAPAA